MHPERSRSYRSIQQYNRVPLEDRFDNHLAIAMNGQAIEKITNGHFRVDRTAGHQHGRSIAQRDIGRRLERQFVGKVASIDKRCELGIDVDG